MSDLERRHKAHPIGPSLSVRDLDTWRAGSDLSRFGLLDRVAAELALGFNGGKLAWEFCDYAVNALVWILYADPPPPEGAEWPDLFWDVYLAFDAGEYRHAERPRAEPVSAYTRPLIAAIVDRLLAAS